MLPGRARGCGFLRKEGVLFGLQGCLGSAPSTACASVQPWPVGSCRRAGRGWHAGCLMVLVGTAPTVQHSQNHGSAMLGAVWSWARWSEQGWSPVSPSLCGCNNHSSSPLAHRVSQPLQIHSLLTSPRSCW